jgi:hypothetical protein
MRQVLVFRNRYAVNERPPGLQGEAHTRPRY